jgi:hypothetical protein
MSMPPVLYIYPFISFHFANRSVNHLRKPSFKASHACIPITWSRGRKMRVQGQPELHRETLSKKRGKGRERIGRGGEEKKGEGRGEGRGGEEKEKASFRTFAIYWQCWYSNINLLYFKAPILSLSLSLIISPSPLSPHLLLASQSSSI